MTGTELLLSPSLLAMVALLLVVLAGIGTTLLVDAGRRRGRQTESMAPTGTEMLLLVAHELRAPLGRIDAAATLVMMQPELGGVPHAAGELAKVRHAVRQMTDLVDTLLRDDWLHAPGTRLRTVRLDIGALLGSVCADRARRTGRRIDLHIAEPLSAMADADLLSIAVGNLIENADRYSPPGEPVRVRLYRRRHQALIEVCDRGPGVASGERRRIFERHYRGRDSRGAGLGLGLHLVRRIMALHGGTVRVAAAEEGGAVFTLHLPGAG